MIWFLLPMLMTLADTGLPLAPGYTHTGELASLHATQAAAADERYAYAVSSTTVAMYDRATGKLIGTSTEPAQHLNSAYLWKGKLYCAHSNYPKKPEESDIRVFDPDKKTLTITHTFKNPPGSLTWAIRGPDGQHWWCCFAHYQQDNAKTILVKMDDEFRELARWTFPEKVIADWDGMSASGGIWDGDTLLTTHHHFQVLYRLKLPANGDRLELVEALACPFPGQGIARDPKSGGLVGIHRPKKQIVFAEKK